MRKVVVRALTRGGQLGGVIGQMVDDGRSEPYGTTEAADGMLKAGRRERFDRYYLGYSNGYTFATEPDVAQTKPEQWKQFLAWARTDGRSVDEAGKLAKLAEMTKG